MSLKGTVSLVVGGSGIVGSGIVGALLGSGAKCWVSSRSDAKFQELQKSLPASLLSQLEMRKVNLCNESETQQLREEILRKEGKLNNVVVSVGGWRTDGKLSTVSVDNYETALRDMTLPHFVCYKTFTKLLSEQPKSSYVFITGGSGEAKFFDPRASMLPVAASTVYGLYRSAFTEYKDNKNMSLIELRLFMWIRKALDSKFDQKKSQLEVGHDWVGRLVPKLILKGKSDVYKVTTRSVGDQLFNTI